MSRLFAYPCLRAIAMLITLTSAARDAAADPIADRGFTVDSFDATAKGSTNIIAQGGVGVVGEGSAGAMYNPAALAVAKATEPHWFAWDFHFDTVLAAPGTDYANNPRFRSHTQPYAGTAGLAMRFGRIAAGAALSYTRVPLSDTQWAQVGTVPLSLAYQAPKHGLALGAAFNIHLFQFSLGTSVYSVASRGLALGATWSPPGVSWRLAARAAYAGSTSDVETADCDPANCNGYALPDSHREPKQLALGGAFRFARSAWHRFVKTPFRDEHSITVSGELSLISSLPRSVSLQGFVANEQQRSGAHWSLIPRAGVEWEHLPGRLRWRAGAYLEPPRVAEAQWRPHVTVGAELAVFEFCVWGARRIRLSATGDFARAYRNGGLSVGFWH